MPDIQQDYKTISKTNKGFPAYLDWEKLREAGLDQLGKLSGRLWTDHNLHDPGITILEMLCYALMDLGYRTNLPAADIFARDPADKSKDDNFFTAAEILACNPVTILDFRKLLVDIQGVRNAWLEDSFYPCHGVYDGPKKSVVPATGTDSVYPPRGDEKETGCSDCYNGLYRVYIEAENDYDTEDRQKYLVKKIRKVLMAHRNLCEDFIDITFLCKAKIGLCADIELETGADVELVYRNVVDKLLEFFSPAPKFYTLRQLSEDRKKSMDEIFAGRPYDIKESHGFVDVEEFEKIELKKEIHLSDVYKVILGVEGVRTVKNLGIKSDCKNTSVVKRDWIWKIPGNHVPEFSATCSTFHFTRNGIAVALDTQKLGELLELGLGYSGKVSYKSPSPYLDVEMPKGIYHSDLGDYTSIQNEFPRVYGINKGGLPLDTGKKRRAQMYQLKGYLLFFDQLFANYVAQLKNMRSLFALKSTANKEDRSTYKMGQLSDVADLEKLIRFNGGKAGSTIAGEEGTVLAIPVEKRWLKSAIETGFENLPYCELNFPPSSFCDEAATDTAILNIQEALLSGAYTQHTAHTSNECWFFYFLSTSGETALVSERFYATERKAKEAADTVKFAATFRDNYRYFIKSGSKYSFNVELKMNEYSQYLQRIMEDEGQYLQRRQYFLDHLLARFAERFTDFATLSFGFFKNDKLKKKEIKYKENFLSDYPALSSQRGKGYDYYLDGWNNVNISGLEKKVYAQAGMGSAERRHLCNFVVEALDDYWYLKIELEHADKEFFRPTEEFYSRVKAETALSHLFAALQHEANYEVDYDESCIDYRIRIDNFPHQPIVYTKLYSDREDANIVRRGLYKLFANTPTSNDVFVSRKIHKVDLIGNGDVWIASCVHPFADKGQATSFIESMNDQMLRLEDWKTPGNNPEPLTGKYFSYKEDERHIIIRIDEFKFNIDDTIKDKPGLFKYELLDADNSFKFQSIVEYGTKDEAQAGCLNLLKLLAHRRNYLPERNEHFDKVELHIFDNEQLIAHTGPDYATEEEAIHARNAIVEFVRSRHAGYAIEETDHRWKFSYLLGYEKNSQYLFTSVDEFEEEGIALDKAKLYYAATPGLQLRSSEKYYELIANNNGEIVCRHEIGDYEPQEIATETGRLQQFLAIKQEVFDAVGGEQPERFIKQGNDTNSNNVFRLVDKNNLHAFYKPFEVNDSALANTERKKLFEHTPTYRYTELKRSDDIIVEFREPNTNRKRYRYRVQCSNVSHGDQHQLILFESVKIFSSREEAMKAFTGSYTLIIKKATDEKNYGPGKFISIQPIEENKYDCERATPFVYIPEETREEYMWYDKDIIAAFIIIAKQFPVRYVTKEEDEFYKLFPCEEDLREPDHDRCTQADDAEKLYYYVLSDDDGKEAWQSLGYFKEAPEAWNRFYFFLLLLRYPGNYTIQQDVCGCKEESKPGCICKWKILIREVLAESKVRFGRDEMTKAWDAVEKFICLSQTEGSFQTYFDNSRCRYTFDVSSGLIHPCKYDTVHKRDNARKELREAYDEFKVRKQPVIVNDGTNKWVMQYPEAGKNLVSYSATFVPPGQPGKLETWETNPYECPAHLFYDLLPYLHTLKKGEHTVTRQIKKNGTDVRVTIKITQSDPNMKIDDWKKLVQAAAEGYPITRQANGKYYVTIRLKGFGICTESENNKDDCGDRDDTNCDCCCIAWKSETCFSTCAEAYAYLKRIEPCLENICNYQRTFDCECGPYTIRLAGCDPNDYYDTRDCCRDILAYNPQWYTHPRMDCDAIKRAKSLINAEGFHLIEHILLRPRCPEDCSCLINVCSDGKVINCECWEWKPGGEEDPCLKKKDEKIYFIPGVDPYSFIATVALPAWPERFRKAENRAIIENLLYLETPAHILLRILWLKPGEFCRIESDFKQWIAWISRQGDNKCTTINPSCDLIKYLFTDKINELAECSSCDENVTLTETCFEPEPVLCNEKTWNVQRNINRLFCWNGETPPPVEIPEIPIEEPPQKKPPDEETPEVIPPKGTPRSDPPRKEPPREPRQKPPKEKRRRTQIANGPEVPSKFLNQRMTNDLASVKKIKTDSGSTKLAQDAWDFIKRGRHSLSAYKKMADAIIKNEKGKSGKEKRLTQKEQRSLILYVTRSYLDNLFYHGSDEAELPELLEKTFRDLQEKGVPTSEIYDAWHRSEFDNYDPGITVDELKNIMKNK